MTATEKGNTIAGRGREALARLVIRFWREQTGTIVANKAAGDYFRLLTLFASWLRQQTVAVDSAQPEPVTNVVISRSLPPWETWVEVVNRATEIMVFEIGTSPQRGGVQGEIEDETPRARNGARTEHAREEARR